MPADLAAAYAHCGTEVRRADPDRWVASLYWPAPARPHAHALFAFALEIARVREAVSEPLLGEIRLQWWRDTIASGQVVGHLVADALIDTIARFNLDAGRLEALVEAHAFDLYDDPMRSEAALEGYLRDTGGSIFEAIARVIARGRLPPPCVDAAGRAWALTGLLRSLPWQVMRGQLYLPLDVLQKFQLPPEHVLAHRNSPALGLVLEALRARVRNHLAVMHAGLADAGPAGAACLPAFLCEAYLRRMEAPGLNPFETPIELSPWCRQWVMWRAARGL